MFEDAETIAELLAQLSDELPSSPTEMIGVSVPQRENDYFAVDAEGNLHLLIRMAEKVPREGRDVGHVTLLFGKQLTLTLEAAGGDARAVVDGTFSAVILPRSASGLMTSFAYLSSGLLRTLPDPPSAEEVTGFLVSLAELLRDQQLDEARLKGVWGELWFLANCRPIDAWLRAWHRTPSDRFDFAHAGVQVDVKTHEGERPIHRFSHEQLAGTDSGVWIVSCILYADRGGWSIADLMQNVESQLTPAQQREFSRKLIPMLAGVVEDIHDVKYRVADADGHRVLVTSEIPRVTVPQGAPISSIQYTVDLTSKLTEVGVSMETFLTLVTPSLDASDAHLDEGASPLPHFPRSG